MVVLRIFKRAVIMGGGECKFDGRKRAYQIFIDPDRSYLSLVSFRYLLGPVNLLTNWNCPISIRQKLCPGGILLARLYLPGFSDD